MIDRPRSIRLRLSLAVVRVAGIFVPRERRNEWLQQWNADLVHHSQRAHHTSRSAERAGRGLLGWSLGSFAHAWYLFRTQFTIDSVWQDVRHGFRSFRSGVGLIAVAVLSLGIGIGANTAVFSLVDVFVLSPLPYPEPDNLVSIYQTNDDRGTMSTFSLPDFRDFRDRATAVDMAAYVFRDFNLASDGQPVRVSGRRVSANFFRMVGVQPGLGRAFAPSEEVDGQHQVVILSDGLWQRQFGADPAVLGRTVLLDGMEHTVVGVMPPNFWWHAPGVDLWAPLSYTGEERRSSHYLWVTGRLAAGATLDQAVQEGKRIAQQLAVQFPQNNGPNGVRVRSMYDELFGGPEYRMGNLVITFAVAFVLLIACANVANLLLARAVGRGRELAIRSALGAGRVRLTRQLLTEAVLISLLGGALGVVLAAFGIKGLIAIIPPSIPHLHEITLNARVLAFTGGISLLTGLLFGLAPALQASNPNLTDALKEGGRIGSGPRGGRLRRTLVVSEVTLAVVLLISSVLLIETFIKSRSSDLGFDESDVLTFSLTLPQANYPDLPRSSAFYTALTDRLSAIPTVGTVGSTSRLPLRGVSNTTYTVPGEDTNRDGSSPFAAYRYVSPLYFAALDVPVLAGRRFDQRDREGAPPVILINQPLADRHWPNSDPVGQLMVVDSISREIVGVVAPTLDRGPEQPPMRTMYLPLHQSRRLGMSWVVETEGPPESVSDAVRAAIAAIDPTLAVFSVLSMDAVIAQATEEYRVMPKIMGVLGLVALVLALGGVYGLMSHAVSQRKQEMGIRLALGASSGHVLSLVVRQGTLLAVIGVAAGAAIALGMTKALAVFLFGVSPFDPIAFGGVAVTLIGAALVASYVPARRASKVDPVEALRSE